MLLTAVAGSGHDEELEKCSARNGAQYVISLFSSTSRFFHELKRGLLTRRAVFRFSPTIRRIVSGALRLKTIRMSNDFTRTYSMVSCIADFQSTVKGMKPLCTMYS